MSWSTVQSSDGGGTAIDGAAIAELRERIQALDDQLNDGDDGALQAAISECQQRIETELREREDIDAEVRSQLSKLEEQLVDSASLPAEILELPDTLTALQATVTELEARGNAAATGTEEIEASVRSIQSATESLEAQFAEAIANRSDDDWQAAMSELATRLDGLQQQLPEAVSINTQSIVSLTEQLTGIEAVLKQVSDADGGTEGLQTLVAELAAKLEGLQQQFPEAVSVNTQSIVSLTEQLGGFEATLQQVSEASSDTEAVQATVSELTTKLEALQQQLPEAVSVNTQSIVSLTEQLTGIDGVLKQVTETSKGDESKAAIAQLEQSIASIEEQLQQALAAVELVDGLQAAQQSLEARIQDAVDLIDQHPSAEQFSELQNRVESGKRVGSLAALIQRAEELEQKPSQPPTWEVDLEEVRKSVELLSRRIPDAYQLNSEATARLEEQLGGLQERITQLADRPEPTVTPEILTDLQEAIAAVQSTQVELKTQLDAIPDAPAEPAESNEADTEDIRAAVTDLTEQLESLSQKLPEAVSYNTQSIVSLQEKLAGLENHRDRQDARDGADTGDETAVQEPVSDSEVSGAIARLETQLAKITAADERLEMLEISYDDIDKRMDAVDLKVVDRASAEELQEVRADLATRAEAQELEKALGQLQELRDAIAHPVPLWQEDIDEIRARLDAVVAQLPEVIQFNTDTAVQLDTQVTALQQQLTVLQENDETASTIARLQDQLIALQDSLDTQGHAGQLVEDTLRSLRQDVTQLSDRFEQMAEQERLREEGAGAEPANDEPWRAELEALAVRLQDTVATVEQQMASVSELEQRISQPLVS
ncbi:MAG: hypothetical protein AAGJ55_04950, partial [Cyanobacteria bacterium J06555_12]